MDDITTKMLRKRLIGTECIAVENAGGYLQIVFTTRRLIIESAWRIIRAGKILASSESDATSDKLSAILLGQVVRDVSTSGPFNDLRLEFSNSILLESFGDSEVYEHWKLIGGPEDMIIAGPGNLWSSF